jgi:hypothetical protein
MSVLDSFLRKSRWASTYAVVVTSRVRSASPVVVRVDSGIGLVGEVARVRSRVGRAVGTRSGTSRAKAAGGVAASVSRPAGVDVGVEGVASVSGVRASGSTSGAETSASVVGG